MVTKRRELAEELSKPFDGRTTPAQRSIFNEVQHTIEQIDKAIVEEKRLVQLRFPGFLAARMMDMRRSSPAKATSTNIPNPGTEAAAKPRHAFGGVLFAPPRIRARRLATDRGSSPGANVSLLRLACRLRAEHHGAVPFVPKTIDRFPKVAFMARLANDNSDTIEPSAPGAALLRALLPAPVRRRSRTPLQANPFSAFAWREKSTP